VIGWATTSTDNTFPHDPADVEAQRFLEQGTKVLEEGDVESAKALYLRSIQIKKTPGVRIPFHGSRNIVTNADYILDSDSQAFFNLGVTHFHSSELGYSCIAQIGL
jgi:hypothetical protein